MPNIKIIYLFALFLALHPGGAAFENDTWITSALYSSVQVKLAPQASVTEQFAAEEFARYWHKTTGNQVVDASQTTPAVTVWIGKEGVPSQLLEGLSLEGLQEESYLIRTRTHGETRRIRGNHLLILGGPNRGVLYGVYHFFEEIMGVRWFTPDFTYFPPQPPETITELDLSYTPPLLYRDTNYRPFVQNPYFSLVHRLNGNSIPLPEEWGGHISYAKAGFGHTFHYFVSPETYGDSHPEYFSEINGKRQTVPNATQLDLTNPDVLTITKQKVAQLLEEAPPNEKIVSITQMDWPFWNESWPQKTIDHLEGSPSGSLLGFVNEVALSIKDRFPHAFIDTFAYTFTRKPPKYVRPLDNVIIRLCSIECDFARPLSDPKSKLNRAFRKDLQRWARITKNLFIWDYTQNWYAFQGPHPNFHVIQPNLKFFTDNGVTGIFEQASPSSPCSDFEYLKAYLIAKALWDPKLDWEDAFHDFIDHYYEAAAPFIYEYLTLITQKAIQPEAEPMTIFSKMEWMDYDTVLAAEGIFKRAFSEITAPTLTLRLKQAHLPVQYAALVCSPKVVITTDTYLLTRPPSQSFEEYWGMLREYGVTHLNDEPIETFKTRLKGKTPPREEVVPIHKLVNPLCEVWVTPTQGGAVRRWFQKNLNLEGLNGYSSPLEDRWIWQEWDIMDPEHPQPERPLETTYQVLSSSTTSLVLQAPLVNGLVITRTMTLDVEKPRLEVVLEIHNQAATPVVPRLKIHPEFWTQGGSRPQLWLEDADGWGEYEMDLAPGSGDNIGTIASQGLLRWAARIAGKELTILNTFQAEELDSLFYFHSPAQENINLELRPLQTPLAPGEKRQLHAAYEITARIPMDEAAILKQLMKQIQ